MEDLWTGLMVIAAIVAFGFVAKYAYDKWKNK